MKTYSIIIPYRNRSSHLELLIPALHEKFKNTDYEIIVAEQDDYSNFRKVMLNNIAAKKSNGKFLIFHDCDHYPDDTDVDYTRIERDNLDVWYPVYKVIYVNEFDEVKKNFTIRDINDVPAGYRIHCNKVHDDHFGGVFCCKRSAFESINGYNPLYIGWGREDSDIYDRFMRKFGTMTRADKPGTFYAMYHADNNPGENDVDFIRNKTLFHHRYTKNCLLDNLGEQSIAMDDVDTYVKEIEKMGVRWLEINAEEIGLDADDPGVKEASKQLAFSDYQKIKMTKRKKK